MRITATNANVKHDTAIASLPGYDPRRAQRGHRWGLSKQARRTGPMPLRAIFQARNVRRSSVLLLYARLTLLLLPDAWRSINRAVADTRLVGVRCLLGRKNEICECPLFAPAKKTNAFCTLPSLIPCSVVIDRGWRLYTLSQYRLKTTHIRRKVDQNFDAYKWLTVSGLLRIRPILCGSCLCGLHLNGP